MIVPWTTILLHGPTIVEAARKLYAAARASTAEPTPTDGMEPLRRAVETLEERDVQHAAVLADLAKQVQEIATAVDALRARLALALVGAALAAALAMLSVSLVLWRAG